MVELSEQVTAIAALAEPVRRTLYEFVSAQPDAVSREAASAGVGVPVHTARFHLDRLVDDGLLETEFRRLSGKTGPGAGRPTKLYRRAVRTFDVSLPERRYDLVGHILAAAIAESSAGTPLRQALDDIAHREGKSLGAASEVAGDDTDQLAGTLASQGYEPRIVDSNITLANCPFDALAREHTELICGLNLHYVKGVLDGLGQRASRACLLPTPGRCCVTVTP
jgi:predicted ArsR family transcriptional regulator